MRNGRTLHACDHESPPGSGVLRHHQSILRNAFAEQKIDYIEDSGKAPYGSALTHGKNKRNYEVFTVEEFIAAITRHIPE
jgi:hypothetical protein